jgi:iron(III) transport system permease protein
MIPFRAGRYGWTMLAVLGALSALVVVTSGDGRSFGLAANSFLLAVGAGAIALPVGVLLAVLSTRTELPGRRIAVALLWVMLFVPLYLWAAAWDAGFGQQGWYSHAFSRLGVPALLSGWRAAVWIHGLAAVPWVALIVGAGLRLVEPELEEQALLDGSAPWVLFTVTLPRAFSTVAIAALWIFVWTASEITVTDLYQVRTYAEVVYADFALGEDPTQASLGALPGVVVVGWFLAAALALCARLAPRARRSAPRRVVVFRLGAWRWPAAALFAALLVLLVGVPLGNVVYVAGVRVEQIDSTYVRTWQVEKLISLVAAAPGKFREEIQWTMLTAWSASSLAVAAALPLAWRARRGGPASLPAMLLAAVGLAIPGPLIGLAVIGLFNQPDSPWMQYLYDNTIAPPCLALFIRGLPLAILILWQAFASVPDERLESASLDGAGPWRQMFYIALPHSLPAIAAAWLAVAVVAAGDLAASILTVPPGITTLAVRIFGLIHYGVDDQVASLTLVAAPLLAAAALGVAALLRPR